MLGLDPFDLVYHCAILKNYSEIIYTMTKIAGQTESETKQLQETKDKLKKSEESFYQMIEAMPQMVWITRPDGFHEFYNKHWYDFTNTTYEHTKGEGWNDMFHPDDREYAWKKWKHSLDTGDKYEIEYRLKHGKSGEWRWVLGRALPLKDESGKIIKWVGTCTDIDEQKRITQNLKYLSEASKILSSSLDYKTTLVNIANLAVPEIADWCGIQMVHDNSLQQLAVAHKDKSKIKWAKELNKKYPPDLDAKSGVSQVIRTGKSEFYPVIPDELLVTSAKDPEHLKIMRKIGFSSVMIVPIREENKTIGAITFVSAESGKHFTQNDLAMAEELSSRASFAVLNASLYKSAQDELKNRRKLEKELLAAKEHLEHRVEERTAELFTLNTELQRSNRELEDFAYVASHDLQEPLRKIQAFGNLLEEEYAVQLQDGKVYISRMQHAAGRMRILIDDLLAFSRITTKAQPKSHVDLNSIVKDTLSDMEVRITELKAKVTVKELPVVLADKTQMRQLFQNLISNALKFHKPGVAPVITIHSTDKSHESHDKQMGVIYIEDNGIGFDEKYLDRIFTVFQRLHGKDEYEGTGVGLAVVRKIIERHDGMIIAKSKPGKGSTFVISLPLAVKGGEHKNG